MKLFGQLIRTAVNVVTLPVDVAKDIATLGGTLTDQNEDMNTRDTHTGRKLQRIKDEAEESPNGE